MLDYDLGEKGDLSLYEFLYRRIKADIADGTIAADDRLPSKRALAQHLGISVVTVEAAYAQLVAEGYVYSRPKSGFYACDLPRTDAAAAAAPAKVARRDAAIAAAHPASRNTKPQVDLTGSAKSLDVSAARIWSRELRAALAQEPEAELFSPTSAQGSPRLRQAVADYLRQSRGMEVDPECIVVAAGAQTLDNLLVQLLGHDAAYAVEDPGYLRLTNLYQANEVQVEHIALDEQGIDMGQLRESGANVVHIMPSHQFPTGRVTSISRRYELLSWANDDTTDGLDSRDPTGTPQAARPSRWIIEDDYDCEFRLAGRPVPSLASIDGCGRVVYTNTFSKSLAAGLRLAYMVLPYPLMQRFIDQMSYLSSTVSSIEQVTLARILESGAYERHVMRVRKRQRETRDALLDALKASEVADRLGIEEADSGLHFVLSVRSEKSEAELAAALLSHGVAAAPMSSFACSAANKTRPDGLARFVIQYEGLEQKNIPAIVQALNSSL